MVQYIFTFIYFTEMLPKEATLEAGQIMKVRYNQSLSQVIFHVISNVTLVISENMYV